jgi:uncharacterized protein YjbI with pentapeptide repeats
MGARLRTWWQQIITHPVTTGLVLLFVTLVVLVIWGGYKLNWGWTGFIGNNKLGKTLWDWLQLLIIPLALAIIAILFNRTERKNEQRIASDNQQEAALQGYIKEMSELLLEKNLRDSQPKDEVRTIARVLTLTVVRRCDAERKASVLQFLYESGLIDKNKRIINLKGADLSGANLIYADLSEADLSEADLSEANLSVANLSGAILSLADMTGANLGTAVLKGADLILADLIGANLRTAYLGEADLSGAELKGANLRAADLSGAKVTSKQLDQALSLKDATMPDGTKHD